MSYNECPEEYEGYEIPPKGASELKAMLYVSRDTLNATTEWLLGREIDIAVGLEDLGEMRRLFVELIGREPRDV